MKTLRIAALTSVFAAFGLMTGCDLFGTDSSNGSPTITDPRLDNSVLQAGGGSTKIAGILADDNTGMNVSFKVLSGTTDKSTSFTIDYKAVPSDSKSWNIGVDGGATIKALASAATGSYTLVYTLTDKDGASASANVAFTVTGGTVIPTGTATTEKTGNVYNVVGKNPGAFDLVSDASVSVNGASASKDLKDITAVGEAFDGSLSTGNGATFVKAATSFDYAGATVESITAAFTAGTALTSIPVPLVGDVYLVKTVRGTTYTYIALKFTVVKSETTTANDGYVTFTYRK